MCRCRVKMLRIHHVDGSKNARQGVLGAGNADDMDVVRHEAVGPDVKIVPPGIQGQQFQVAGVVIRLAENRLAVIAPLGNVVGVSYRYGARYSRHN